MDPLVDSLRRTRNQGFALCHRVPPVPSRNPSFSGLPQVLPRWMTGMQRPEASARETSAQPYYGAATKPWPNLRIEAWRRRLCRMARCGSVKPTKDARVGRCVDIDLLGHETD